MSKYLDSLLENITALVVALLCMCLGGLFLSVNALPVLSNYLLIQHEIVLWLSLVGALISYLILWSILSALSAAVNITAFCGVCAIWLPEHGYFPLIGIGVGYEALVWITLFGACFGSIVFVVSAGITVWDNSFALRIECGLASFALTGAVVAYNDYQITLLPKELEVILLFSIFGFFAARLLKIYRIMRCIASDRSQTKFDAA